MVNKKYDLIILGGGAAAFVAACKMTTEDIRDIAHVFLTMSEMVKKVA